MNYLAVGPYCWGKAKSPDEAVRLAKMNWSPLYSRIKRPQKVHFSIYASEGDFTIDGMGTIECTQKMEKLQTSSLAVA